MRKSIAMPAAVAFAAAALLLLPPRTHDAAAQGTRLYLNVADLDVVPADREKFVASIKEAGAAAVKEPGCHEFDIAASQKDPNHIVLFEVWDSAAALDALRATDHFKKFMADTKDMVAKRALKAMWSVALNGSSPAQAGLFINAIDLNIVPAQFDAFMAAAKGNSAATLKDRGAREFDIAVSQKDPHHLMFLEVYDSAAALDAHRVTEHYKAYQAATKGMVANRNVDRLWSIAMNRQPM